MHCVLLSAENAALGKYHFSQAFKPDIPVIWRGWMLKEDYQQLFNAVAVKGGRMLESPAEYISNHHITGWYHACQEYTLETVFAFADSDFALLTKQL